MNRFRLLKCIDAKEEGYNGTCIVMSCVSNPSFVLFFPISKDSSKIINYVLKENSKYDINTNIVGIYKTMVDSWKASDRYLSGIIMDTVYDEELKDDILSIKLVLADSDGFIDGLVPVNFLHAVMLSAMEKTDIVMGDKLLSHMIPDEEEEKSTPTQHFPEDKKIVDIAKKIMNGKIKDDNS